MKALKRLTALAISAALLISAASLVSAAPQKKTVPFANTDFQKTVDSQPTAGGTIPDFSTKIGKPTAPADPFVANSGVGYEAVAKPTDNTFTATVPGEQCLHFWDTNAKGNTTGGSDELGVWSYAKDVQPNTEYTVKISALITDIDNGSGGVVQSRIRYGLYFFDAGGDQIKPESAADIGRTSSLPEHNPGKNWPDGFKDYQTTFTSPANAVKARVAVWSTPIYQCNAYIDDIEVYSMEEEAPPEPEDPTKLKVPYKNADFEEAVETQPANGGSIPGFGLRNKCTPVAPANPMNANTGIGYEVVAKPTDNTLGATVPGEQALHFWDTNAKGNTTIGASDQLGVYSYAQTVEPNTEYTVKISAMVMDLADRTQSRIRYGLYFFDESGSEIKTEFLADIGRSSKLPGHNPGENWPTGFQDYQTTFTSPANAVKARVGINSSPLYQCNAYIDDIEVYTVKEEEPPAPVTNEVYGWTHRENIIFPEQGPSKIYEGEGVGFEIVDKPAGLTDSVTPTGTIADERCLHFFDYNYSSAASAEGVWNELYLYSEALPVTAGTEYHVAFEAMVGNVPGPTETRAGKFRFGIFYYDNNGTQLGNASDYFVSVGENSSPEGMKPPVDEWKDYTYHWTAPAGAATAKIRLSTTPIWVANLYMDNVELYSMSGGSKQPLPVVNPGFSLDGPEDPEPGLIQKEIFNGDFEDPVVLPETGLVPGWIHRSGIVIPEEPPAQIFQGEGIGYEIVHKPASLEGSVTPSGTVAGEKCMHFYDFNYNKSAQAEGVWNELYLYSDELPVKAGTDYHVAFSAMVGDVPDAAEVRDGRFRFGILYYDNQGEMIGTMGDYIVSVGANDSPSNMQRPVSSWKDYSMSWTAPAGAVTAKISINTTPYWVANIFIDDIEFYSMDGNTKNPLDVNNADFNLEKQEIQADLAPGWSVLQGPAEGTTSYEVVEKPVDLAGSSTVANDHSLKLTDHSATEAITLAGRTVPVKAGVTYQVGFDALVSGTVQVGLMFFGPDTPVPVLDGALETIVKTVEGNDLAAQWQTMSHSGQAPDGAAYAAVVIKTDVAGQTEKAFIDNITVQYEFSGSTVLEPLFRLNSGEGLPGGIVEAAGKTVSVSVPYINGLGTNQSATVIVGVFGSDHRMLSMKKTEDAVMTAGKDGEIMLEVQVPETIDGSYVKVIVIDGLDRISPVIKGLLD